jgi:hypothetical protein
MYLIGRIEQSKLMRLGQPEAQLKRLQPVGVTLILRHIILSSLASRREQRLGQYLPPLPLNPSHLVIPRRRMSQLLLEELLEV